MRDLIDVQRHYRHVGFDHGYSGKPATNLDASYQQGWRSGRKARERDGLEPSEPAAGEPEPDDEGGAS